jgi:Protein of unknown function (DUF3014)
MANPPVRRGEPRAEPRIDSDPEPEWTATSTDARAPFKPRPASRQSPLLWVLLLIVLAGGGALFYLWRHNAPALPVVTAPPASAPVAPEAAAPAIRHPIEEAQSAAAPAVETKPLPALMTSDTTMQNTLADLFGAPSLGKVFYEDAIIHRFVTTIDNLPRKSVPSRNLPVKPLPGPLLASSTVSIAADNAARYAPYVQLAEAIDSKKLVAAYVHFYPLIQQDYRDLGYPKGYFNDRLIEAIDDLLAAPELSDPPQLVQPKILYQYADPDLEGLSAGQKIMIRMGPDNAAKVKAKLREILAGLTGSRGANPTPAKQAQ